MENKQMNIKHAQKLCISLIIKTRCYKKDENKSQKEHLNSDTIKMKNLSREELLEQAKMIVENSKKNN